VISSLVTVTVLSSLAVASVALYLLPVLIGLARHVPDIGAVAVIDILLGWTLIGWVVALAMALRSVNPTGPVVQLVQHLPLPPPPPAQLPGARWAGPAGPPPARPGSAPPLVLPPRPAADYGEAGDER
jgi:Superinfection immunity protein